MKPIDADKLKELYEPYKGLDVPCAVVCQNIDDMPTVQPQGIDKDRLIRDLNLNTNYGFYGEFTDGSEIAFTLRELIAIINQQPTSDGWIPCSRELPKENGKYFVTIWDEIIGLYTTEWHFYNGNFTPFVYYTNRRILAWQPLPQPYKEV